MTLVNGYVCYLVIAYYRTPAHRWERALIAVDFLVSIFLMVSQWWYLINVLLLEWATTSFQDAGWPIYATPGLGGTMLFISQAFYARRLIKVRL